MLVRWWCSAAASVLGLRSYLLGNGNYSETAAAAPQPAAAPRAGLAAAHQALLQMESPTGWQPYDRPSAFGARLAALLFAVCVSLVIASAIALVIKFYYFPIKNSYRLFDIIFLFNLRLYPYGSVDVQWRCGYLSFQTEFMNYIRQLLVCIFGYLVYHLCLESLINSMKPFIFRNICVLVDSSWYIANSCMGTSRSCCIDT